MLTRLRFLLVLVAAWVLVGCNQYHLSDDIDLVLDFSWTVSDELHLPYVQGATVVLSAGGLRDSERSQVVLESSDDNVLRIDSQVDARATCVAVGPGTAMVSFSLDGVVLHEAEVRVGTPARAVLLHHGPLVAGRLDLIAFSERHQPRLLRDGLATFLVQYFGESGERLHGNGALATEASAGATAVGRRTFLFENQEWLQVTAQEPGLHRVALTAGGVSLGDFVFTGVEAEDVDRIEIFGGEANADEGDEIVLLARALDAEERPIYGIDYTWDVDGFQEPGAGDLYRYNFDPAEPHGVRASFGARRSESFTVHSSGGFVDSSNNIGCRASGGPVSSDYAVIAAAAALSLGRRRRAAVRS